MLNIKFLTRIETGQSVWISDPAASLIMVGNQTLQAIKCLNLNRIYGIANSGISDGKIAFRKIVAVNDSLSHPCFLYLIDGYEKHEIENIILNDLVSKKIEEENFKFFDQFIEELPDAHLQPISTFMNEEKGINAVVVLVHNKYRDRNY